MTEGRRAVCWCVSSWKLPGTWRDEDGARRCRRCNGLRERARGVVLTEDVRDLAELELAEGGGGHD